MRYKNLLRIDILLLLLVLEFLLLLLEQVVVPRVTDVPHSVLIVRIICGNHRLDLLELLLPLKPEVLMHFPDEVPVLQELLLVHLLSQLLVVQPHVLPLESMEPQLFCLGVNFEDMLGWSFKFVADVEG